MLPLGTGGTAAPRCVLSPSGPPPSLLDGAAKVTVAGNLAIIALLKFCELWSKGQKSKFPFISAKRGASILTYSKQVTIQGESK